MCCILYIPSGEKTPPITILKTIHRANPHGIGFVDADGNSLKTLDLSCFLQAVKQRHTDAACIIHFRLATHGSISEKNCHPFHDTATDIWFAHNGVLPIVSKNDMTDSEIFFREVFIPILNEVYDGDIDAPGLWQFVDRRRGSSRFIFMHGDDIRMFGQWYERQGVFYSNLNWL